MSETEQSSNILSCERCQATGMVGLSKCPTCHGLAMGWGKRGNWLYWGYPLSRFNLALSRARQIFNKIRLITVILIGLNFWVWFGLTAYRANLFHSFWATASNPFLIIKSLTPGMVTLFWLGLLLISYAYYRFLREAELKESVERYKYNLSSAHGPQEEVSIDSWVEALKISRRKRKDISATFTREALAAIGQAYRLADKNQNASVLPVHLFYSLLSSHRVSNIFIRLGIPVSSFKDYLQPLFAKDGQAPLKTANGPAISNDVRKILFLAYEQAYFAHQDYVSVADLLLALTNEPESLKELLLDLDIGQQKLVNVIEWARIREKLHRQYIKFRQAARHRSTHGMDRAMTAVATPYLNQFSDDLTILAQFGYTEACVAREREIEEIFRIVEGGNLNVLLVGDYGVGKKSIVEGIAQKMVEEDVPLRLKDKRLVRLSVSALLSGTTPSGAVERLRRCLHEIARAGNIILFIHNIHELVGVSAGAEGGQSLDVAGALSEQIKSGRFMTIATTTNEAFAQAISNSNLGNVFAKVDIAEMDVNQAIQVLESKVGQVEYKQQVFFAYAAVEKAVELARRFVHENYLPGSALEVMTEAASLTRNQKGANSLVTGEEVAKVVAEKTKIPVTTVTVDETTKLLHLEEAMHQRVIGQDEAVNLVANALRRSRAEIRSEKRPIANFLFLGPTGVGKTELAKTIAAVYFGGEERMVRLDMSEYQDKTSISRLIGSAGEKGSGLLTETIRRHPFVLLLLDEIEKADKDILNLFLQVMDDGRLTDSTGRVVDFTNVILIATSNAGTTYVGEQTRAGVSSDLIKDHLLHGELKQYFRPEFLNRFDGIVLFKPLSQEDIKKVAGLMLKQVAGDLEAKGITLRISEGALDFLATVGFDPEFGARPMRRALQERVEDKLAALLLSGQLKRRDTVVLGANGEIMVE